MTIEELTKSISLLVDSSLREYMVEHGFDPDKGGLIVVPESMRHTFGPLAVPSFVRFSKFVTDVLMFIDPLPKIRH